MADQPTQRGRVRPAPENFLTETDIIAVKEGRRDFLRNALLTASATLAGGASARAADGDPNILTLPAWTTSLASRSRRAPTACPPNTKRPAAPRVPG
jgi:sulfane dehydrogenase subunit SoxC